MPDHSTLPLDSEAVALTTRPVTQATMLPPAAFADPAVLAWEMEHLYGGWVCLGHSSLVGETGAYLMREIGDTSVFALRGEDDVPRVFLNTCRHRGSRLVEEAEGLVRRRIQCPYHAWSYGLDGSLAAAPHMDAVEDFDRSCFGLMEVRSAEAMGLLFCDLSGEAPGLDEHVGELASKLAGWRIGDLRRAGSREYMVEANWKALAENYNECLHCPGVHPELNALSDYRSGNSQSGDGAWCGGSMALNEGTETMGRNGDRRVQRPAIDGLDPSEHSSVYYYALFPNTMISLHPDYVMLHTLWPRAVDRTDVVCEWYFEPETISEDGFDPSDAIDFWDQVNREDWRVCELTQKGVRARGYVAGRYSGDEGDVHAFDAMVAERYLKALQAG